ncbi:cupin domain-containing protein [Streptomyces europaeiscabiei]|uniref:Cupin n=3 Tax=Streptomyces europaeiscabiei TaxID=146819 RepID=A0ABU4NR23_9ACTN|nr:cupin [Streptomyces europaeiscabiei]MDX2529297.1 cupin [Streptomyces europaeiscabiei]MDX2761770.1 cupin [Streptomyces europaeiscabiei]MDX2768457.1 cupin [Streptomyces europaeiscabiei]MDX3546396.1 cupin [Streptomyces europaeiscabiei]MDX3556090.1 cupin [Streptomyces europaeiscabiei]
MVSGYEGLPGGVAVSHLAVYDWPATDGVCGGTPHMHLTCSEAYVVTGGRGAVQTLTTSGYEVTPLAPGTVAWFTPGTIHRLVNEDDLRITVLMQNSGLPEAGDAVLTLPPEHLTDPRTYAAATRIPLDAPQEEQERVARTRRDLALEGYRALRDASGPEPLAAFHRAAAALVRPRLAEWRARWEQGARSAAAATGEQLDRLERGDLSHLADAVVRAEEPSAYGKFGMCGRLDVYKGD